MDTIGLFEKIFQKQQIEQKVNGYFKTFSAYTPSFTSFEGSIYEMELTRSAVHAFAVHASKLKPEFIGDKYQNLGKKMEFKPNPFMDTSKFIYRLATCLAVDNNTYIVPLYSDDGRSIKGYYPIKASRVEMVDMDGIPYLRYTFSSGQKAAIELEKVGILNQFQYSSDFFGESNSCFYPTLQLINTQNQGIIDGVKSAATIRFLARLANTFKPSEITLERQRFVTENLGTDNNSGVMMFDAKYAEVKQIDSKPFIVDDKQMAIIKSNVYDYFGVNESILQNSFTPSQWDAFYEGKVEPFAIQLSLVMSNMTFTEKEIADGNSIIFSSNRMQYAAPETKLAVVTQLFDRGFITHNTGCEVFNLPTREDGDKFYIRQEYIETENLNKAQGVVVEKEEQEGEEVDK